MDTGALYGEMAGSWLLHLAIPIGVYSALSSVLSGVGDTKTIMYIVLGISIGISILVQLGFLTFLQALSCGGVKNIRGILAGTLAAAAITAFGAALPMFIEGLRLTISQIIITHLPIFTPQQFATYQKITEDAIALASSDATLTQGATAQAQEMISKIGLTPEKYEQQTLKETVAAMSYMSAFSGAFGIGIGSFYAGKCDPNIKGD
jgi:hypothetical protein